LRPVYVMTKEKEAKPSNIHILLYPCNVVGYVRLLGLVVILGVVLFFEANGREMGVLFRFGLAIALLIDSLILDIVDGYLARKLGHATKFGAVFELAIDLITHTTVWFLSGLTIAPLFIIIEWTCGLFIAVFILSPDESWKIYLREKGPWLVRVYWARPSINLLNNYSNAAHFVYPMTWFVFGEFNLLSGMALPGLIIFELVSLYMIYVFTLSLLEMEQGTQTENS